MSVLNNKGEIREKFEVWLSQHDDNVLFETSIKWESTLCIQKSNYINR